MGGGPANVRPSRRVVASFISSRHYFLIFIINGNNNMADPVGPPSSSAALTEPLLVGGSDEGPGDDGSAPIPSHPQQLRNIKFILAYTVLMFAGRSMWSQTVLSAYVYLLRDNNAEAVGLLTAIMGISQLLLSFPTGYLADKFRRDTLLKSASVFGFVAISTTVVAVHRRSYSLLALALALWGALWGLSLIHI